MLALDGLREGTLKFTFREGGGTLHISKHHTPPLFFKGLEVGDSILRLSWSAATENMALAHLYNTHGFPKFSLCEQPALGLVLRGKEGIWLVLIFFFFLILWPLGLRLQSPHPLASPCSLSTVTSCVHIPFLAPSWGIRYITVSASFENKNYTPYFSKRRGV